VDYKLYTKIGLHGNRLHPQQNYYLNFQLFLGNTLFRTIEKPVSCLYCEKGSKFLSFAYPVSASNEIRTVLDALCSQ
jgi:hypothetical protein